MPRGADANYCSPPIPEMFCLQRVQPSPVSMPSMVRTDWPSASAASSGRNNERYQRDAARAAIAGPASFPFGAVMGEAAHATQSSMVSPARTKLRGSPLMVVETMPVLSLSSIPPARRAAWPRCASVSTPAPGAVSQWCRAWRRSGCRRRDAASTAFNRSMSSLLPVSAFRGCVNQPQHVRRNAPKSDRAAVQRHPWR